MANDQPPDDPFRVRLSWPGRSEQSARLPGDRDEPVAAEASAPRAPDRPVERAADAVFEVDVPEDEASVLYTVANRLEGLRAALGTMGLRLDALIRRDEEFREFTTARLAEYAEQIAAGVGTASAEMEETSRSHARSLSELTTGLTATTESMNGMAQQTAAVAAGVDRVASAVAELTTLVHDHTALLNDQTTTVQEQAAAQLAEIEVVRAELVAAVAQAEERDEELATEVANMAEEMRALRRRMTVRAGGASGAASKPAAARRRPPADEEVYDDEPAKPARRSRSAR